MEFTVYVETEDPRFTGRTFQLRDGHGDVWDAFATMEDLLEGARELQRKAQEEATSAQEEVDGLAMLITRMQTHCTTDLSWILADGESLEDALEDFAEDVANPERVKRRHDAIRALADPPLENPEK